MRTHRLRHRSSVTVAVIVLVGAVVAGAVMFVGMKISGGLGWDGIAAGSEGSAVSGVPMPVGDLPQWRQVFADDFDRDTLGENWGAYSGRPGGDPYSWWTPGHVDVGDSVLVLEGYQEQGQWVTGGVSNSPVTQTYGKWEVRFRADPSDEITYHLLLWPNSTQWPPEIDFLEDWGGNRNEASGWLHYKTPSGKDKIQRSITADFADWQTVGVEWLPGKVTYTLNGEPWGTVEGSAVPTVPMWLALQAQAGGCRKKADAGSADCPLAGTPDNADVEFDWVVVYEPIR